MRGDAVLLLPIQTTFVGLTLPPVAFHVMFATSGGDSGLEHERLAGTLVAVSFPRFTVTALCPVEPDEQVSVAFTVSTTFALAAAVMPGLIVWLPDIVQWIVPHALNGGGARADAGLTGAIATRADAASIAATESVSHRRSMV
jgi:hypothetical protein